MKYIDFGYYDDGNKTVINFDEIRYVEVIARQKLVSIAMGNKASIGNFFPNVSVIDTQVDFIKKAFSQFKLEYISYEHSGTLYLIATKFIQNLCLDVKEREIIIVCENDVLRFTFDTRLSTENTFDELLKQIGYTTTSK